MLRSGLGTPGTDGHECVTLVLAMPCVGDATARCVGRPLGMHTVTVTSVIP